MTVKKNKVKYHEKLRREFKMTPKEIADAIRSTRQSTYNWFGGRSEPQPVFRDALKVLYEKKSAERRSKVRLG